MPSLKNYSILFAVGASLAVTSFVISEVSQCAGRKFTNRSHRTELLNKIAEIHLQPGMTVIEVRESLELHNLRQVAVARSGGSMTSFHGSGSLFDPVIGVNFKRNADHTYVVIDWHVEQ